MRKSILTMRIKLDFGRSNRDFQDETTALLKTDCFQAAMHRWSGTDPQRKPLAPSWIISSSCSWEMRKKETMWINENGFYWTVRGSHKVTFTWEKKAEGKVQAEQQLAWTKLTFHLNPKAPGNTYLLRAATKILQLVKSSTACSAQRTRLVRGRGLSAPPCPLRRHRRSHPPERCTVGFWTSSVNDKPQNAVLKQRREG